MPATLHTAWWINTGINGWPESSAIKASMKFVYLAAELYSAGDIWHNNAQTAGSVIKSVFRCFPSSSLAPSLTLASDAASSAIHYEREVNLLNDIFKKDFFWLTKGNFPPSVCYN